MKMICVIIITAFITSLMWKIFHVCPLSVNEKVLILEKGNIKKDSILNLWFNDYTWHMRVMAGIEKDTAITKYERWNKKKIK